MRLKLKEEIISKVDDKEAEDASDMNIWEMEPGKVYVKDSKLYICTASNGSATQDYQAITIGTDGLRVVGYDSTLTPPNYERDVYDNDGSIHVVETDEDFRNSATSGESGFWFIKGSLQNNIDPKIVVVSEVAQVGEDIYTQRAFAFAYSGYILKAVAQGSQADTMSWPINPNYTYKSNTICDIEMEFEKLATTSSPGLMSASDKNYLDIIKQTLINLFLSDTPPSIIEVHFIENNRNTGLFNDFASNDPPSIGISPAAPNSNANSGIFLFDGGNEIYFFTGGTIIKGTYNNNTDSWDEEIIFSENILAAKAPLASPAFTGTPIAPTAASGTNTTQIATTAFVQGELANRYPMVTITEADYQDLVDDDEVDPNVLYVIVDNT